MSEQYMAEALALAGSVYGAVGPNPRVGCVIVDASGAVVGRGAHHGAGTAHAEVVALADAGSATHGATAYVTLEPCNHHGRTPPCSQALLAAGIRAVRYAVADPTPAAGGAQFLRDQGLDVVHGPLTQQAQQFLEPWLFAITHQRPFVTYKVASTLDGFVAAADGSSRWITGEIARDWAHSELRAMVDAIAVGSATYTTDNPQLTVRGRDVVQQPRRIVLGDVAAEGFWVMPGHDPVAGLTQMYDAGIRHLLLEGGPTVGAAFVRAGVVDEVVWITAPKLLGSGTSALAGLGIATVNDAVAWNVTHTKRLGEDVLIRCRRP